MYTRVMASYPEYPLKALRDDLGRVVDQVNSAGCPVVVTKSGTPVAAIVPLELINTAALPPAYFDEAARTKLIAELDARIISRYTADQVAEARAWAAHAFPADAGAHDAA